MANTFLKDLALAHQRHEGYYYNTIAYRLNNPGNLRGVGGAFIHFPTYNDGFRALMGDLYVKIMGTARSIKNFMKGSGKTYEQVTFQDYVSIYAPSADNNNPVRYCDALCKDLRKYNVQPSTTLPVLKQLVLGEIDTIREIPSAPMSLEKRKASVQNALKFAKPERRSMLLRLLDRINKALYS